METEYKNTFYSNGKWAVIRTSSPENQCNQVKRNKVCIQQKTAAFEGIARLFNANVGVSYRTSKQLRQKYFNLKKDANKLTLQRDEIRKTLGGIPVIDNLLKIEESILSMNYLCVQIAYVN